MLKGLLWVAGRHRQTFIIGTALRVAEALLSTVPLVMLYLFLIGVANGEGSRVSVWEMAAMILGAAVFQVILLQASTRLCYKAGLSGLEDLRYALADHLRRVPLGYFIDRNVGEVSEHLVQDLNVIQPAVTHFLPKSIANIALGATLLGAMALIDPIVGLLCLAGLPVALPLLFWSQRRLKRLAPRRVETQAEAATRVLEFVMGLPVLKSLLLTDSRFRLVRAAVAANRKANIDLVASVVPTGIGYAMALELGFPAIALIGALAVADDSLALSALLFGLVAVLKLYLPLQYLMAYSAHLRLGETAVNRVRSVLNTPVMTEPTEPRNPASFEVGFHGVTFGYTDAPVLRDVNCVLPERGLTAITGPSGAGKTTFAHLIARYWDVSEGSVRIGGVDVRDIESEALNNLVSVVHQQVFLFDDTIMDNIRLGRPSATKDEVLAAARAARCHDFIKKLPDGYGTRIGEIGACLSGGERQRLSIARSILKNAPIVILDEPTASVDPQNESEIQKAITNLVAENTVLMIAHRLSTIVHAHQILVMDQGRVIGCGQHESLLTNCPLYRSLWDRQNLDVAPGLAKTRP